MSGLACQRWELGRDRYRPTGEVINPRQYEVSFIDTDRVARAFVEQHHYSKSYPAARERVGLYRFGRLVGVAVFSHPCNDLVISRVFPTLAFGAGVELGRFVLLDEVPGNGESWFIARCFEQLRQMEYRGVLAFSDPVARTLADGTQIFPGHIGTIYQATNAVYVGRGTARTLQLFADGRVFSARTHQKIRAAERGWRAGVALLQGAGADALSPDADSTERREWLRLWVPRLLRPLRHLGNYRYAWNLRRGVQPSGCAPYPKKVAA